MGHVVVRARGVLHGRGRAHGDHKEGHDSALRLHPRTAVQHQVPALHAQPVRQGEAGDHRVPQGRDFQGRQVLFLQGLRHFNSPGEPSVPPGGLH